MVGFLGQRQFSFRAGFWSDATRELQFQVEAPGTPICPEALKRFFQGVAQRERAFFKKVVGRFLFGWDIRGHTQARFLHDFVIRPIPEKSGASRAPLVEDITSALEKSQSSRIYQLGNPAHLNDQAPVSVQRDSPAGQILAKSVWTDISHRKPQGRLPTLRLKWSSDSGSVLVIDGILSWEISGVGGTPGNHEELKSAR